MGELFALLAAGAFALATVLSRRFMVGRNPVAPEAGVFVSIVTNVTVFAVLAAFEYARMLAVETRLVLERLFPKKKREPVPVVSMPPLVFDRGEFTVDNVRLACEWLADALAVVGRDALADPAARSAMERAHAALDYLLRDALSRI